MIPSLLLMIGPDHDSDASLSSSSSSRHFSSSQQALLLVWRPSELQQNLREGDVVLISGLVPSPWQGGAEVMRARSARVLIDLDTLLDDVDIEHVDVHFPQHAHSHPFHLHFDE